MRNISFALTTDQVRKGTKTVTRRMGWQWLVDACARGAEVYLMACEKCMGRKKGEPLVRLRVIEVLDARRELLDAMIVDRDYGQAECSAEGFPDMSPEEFVAFFQGSHAGCQIDSEITRIHFRYADEHPENPKP